MPTDMSSAELEQLPVEVMEVATVSARTMTVKYLDAMEAEVRDILEPRTVTRTEDGGLSREVTVGKTEGVAELNLQKVWQALGYEAPDGKEGTLEDLASDVRVKLVVDMNRDMALGFGQWRQAQDVDALDLFPCFELFRLEERINKRDWHARWEQAARAVGDEHALRALQKHKRMVARKDSPIWEELSRFKTPYPPFDFNSGMWIREVDRDEAVALEVVGEWDRIVPQHRAFEALKEAA